MEQIVNFALLSVPLALLSQSVSRVLHLVLYQQHSSVSALSKLIHKSILLTVYLAYISVQPVNLLLHAHPVQLPIIVIYQEQLANALKDFMMI